MMVQVNTNLQVIADFGKEWKKFDQSLSNSEDERKAFNSYFKIFPLQDLRRDMQGFDLGCGSGRWAKFISPKVGKLYCIDPSEESLNVAKFNLRDCQNVEFINSAVENLPLKDRVMDFGYSLGVLHHVADTQKGIEICVAKLKAGAPLLLYLYYAFDNKPAYFKMLWWCSDKLRSIISKLPFGIKYPISQFIALFVYYPLARMALLLEKMNVAIDDFPLSAYRRQKFYVMRTDALDRFGTRVEKRFTAKEIRSMMELAGLGRVKVGESFPYWCAIGYKK